MAAIYVLQTLPPLFKIYTKYERKTMRKLALSDEILLKVDKAARYIGGEVNSIMKDKKEVTTRVAFCFSDVCD